MKTAQPAKAPKTQKINVKLGNVEKGGNIRFGREDVRSSVYISKSFFAPDFLKGFIPAHDAEAETYPDYHITLVLEVPDGYDRAVSQEGDYVLPGRPAALPTDKDGVDAMVEAAEAAKRRAERAARMAEKAQTNLKRAQEMLAKKDATKPADDAK